MNPRSRYQQDLARHIIVPDPAQLEAVEALQELFERLRERRRSRRGLYARLLARWRRPEPLKGLYLWGGVGRGKTYLMDLFYQCLPEAGRLRRHFHRFMNEVHRDLARLREEKNPLRAVAAGIAARTQVLCFDEFFVADIGDAMILGNLLEALFEEGVVLVATSNIEPSRLYENGLHRARFLPTIALLEANVKVLKMAGGLDYRLRSLEQAEIYHSPLDEAAEAQLLGCFKSLSPGLGVGSGGELEILGRRLNTRALGEGVVWFDFAELCEGPRSAADYIELAQLFHTVLISAIPRLDAGHDEAARRFISLVDEFYDHNVKLIVSAAVTLEALYQGENLAFAFARTRSRLQEMQSHEYLAREHKP